MKRSLSQRDGRTETLVGLFRWLEWSISYRFGCCLVQVTIAHNCLPVHFIVVAHVRELMRVEYQKAETETTQLKQMTVGTPGLPIKKLGGRY